METAALWRSQKCLGPPIYTLLFSSDLRQKSITNNACPLTLTSDLRSSGPQVAECLHTKTSNYVLKVTLGVTSQSL